MSMLIAKDFLLNRLARLVDLEESKRLFEHQGNQMDPTPRN